MRRPGWLPADDLLLLAVLTVALLVLATLTNGHPRTVLGVAYILAVPGYALVCALFPRRSSLGAVERLALSLGISFAVVSLILLVLNYTPLGLRFWPVLIGLTGFTTIVVAIAWFRRSRLEPGERSSPSLLYSPASLTVVWTGSRFSKALTVAIAISIVLMAGTATLMIARPNPGDAFTEFYILDSSGKPGTYPRELMVGEMATVLLGIVNTEYQAVSYRVDITVSGTRVKTLGPINLVQGHKYEEMVQWAASKPGEKQEVDFLLYKDSGSEPYRSLRLWIDVKSRP